jgi:hypothetical protein
VSIFLKLQIDCDGRTARKVEIECANVIDANDAMDAAMDATERYAAPWFDYTHQAWVVAGRYSDCGHEEGRMCGCYGREHKGDSPTSAIVRQYRDADRKPALKPARKVVA